VPAVEEAVEPAGAVSLAGGDRGIALLSRCWRWRYRTGQNEKKNSPDARNRPEWASVAALVRHGTLSLYNWYFTVSGGLAYLIQVPAWNEIGRLSENTIWTYLMLDMSF